jgi:hypothetical protein
MLLMVINNTVATLTVNKFKIAWNIQFRNLIHFRKYMYAEITAWLNGVNTNTMKKVFLVFLYHISVSSER